MDTLTLTRTVRFLIVSGELDRHPIKASNLDEKKAVRSLLSVNNFQRCTLPDQKSLEYKPASTVYRFNQEEANSTRTGLNPEVGR